MDSREQLLVFRPGTIVSLGVSGDDAKVKASVVDVRVETGGVWYSLAWYVGADRKTAVVPENEVWEYDEDSSKRTVIGFSGHASAEEVTPPPPTCRFRT